MGLWLGKTLEILQFLLLDKGIENLNYPINGRNIDQRSNWKTVSRVDRELVKKKKKISDQM